MGMLKFDEMPQIVEYVHDADATALDMLNSLVPNCLADDAEGEGNESEDDAVEDYDPCRSAASGESRRLKRCVTARPNVDGLVSLPTPAFSCLWQRRRQHDEIDVKTVAAAMTMSTATMMNHVSPSRSFCVAAQATLAQAPTFTLRSAMLHQGECAISICASSPRQVSDHVLDFLNKEVPTHISRLTLEPSEGQPCQLCATVFVDYIPIQIEVSTYAEDDRTVAVIKHPSQSDILRFHLVLERLISSLRSSNLHVTSAPQQAPAASFRMLDDDFEDDISADDEATWSERISLVEDMMSSSDASLREEALQDLAHWAACDRVNKAVLADVLVKLHLQGVLPVSTATPLAEMYPVAAVLRQLSDGVSPEARDILSHSALCVALEKMYLCELPPIITRELEMTVKGLRMWKAFSKKLSPLSALQEFSSNSTTCSDVAPSDYFSDDDGEMFVH